jgi:hypothetical protein
MFFSAFFYMFMSIIIFYSLEKLYLIMFNINYFEHCDKKMALIREKSDEDEGMSRRDPEIPISEEQQNDLQDDMQNRIHGFIMNKITHYDLDSDRVKVICPYSKFLHIRPNNDTYTDGRFSV